MINFVIQAYYSYKGLFQWLNWPGYTFNVLLRPLMMVIMFTLLGRFAADPERAEAFLIGMAAYSIPLILIGGILQTFFFERSYGTLSVIFSSGGNRLVTYLSRGALHYPNGVLSVTATFFSAWLILDIDLSMMDWLSVSLSVAIITASCTTFSLFTGNFCIITRYWGIVAISAQDLLLCLTGVIVPTARLPGFLGEISHLLPLTHGLVAFRQSFGGAGVASVADDLLIEMSIGMGYAVAGILLFRFMEKEIKRRGILEDAI